MDRSINQQRVKIKPMEIVKPLLLATNSSENEISISA